MKKMGIVSFIPDAGHILPLMRIAQTFAENQYDVICYLPEEGLKYASDFRFTVKSIGKVTVNARSDVFERISRMPVFYFAMIGYAILKKDYFCPIRDTIDENLERIIGLISQDGLSFIIADKHVFEPQYSRLADSMKIPLVLHHSEGSLRYLQKPKVSSFGLNHCPLWINILYPFTYFPLMLINKVIVSLMSGKKSETSRAEDGKTILISSGLGLVEKNIRGIMYGQKERKAVHFPPVIDRRSGRVSARIDQWLDRSRGKPVVYVSLGTMIRANAAIMENILRGLEKLDVRILLVASQNLVDNLKNSGIAFDDDILAEEFVPQAEILSDDAVSCFIPHGGSGGVQESLLNGKPMLCIPFTFDQPYNSSIISILKAGIRIDKNRVTPERIRIAVSRLLGDPLYGQSAKRIRDQLTSMEGGSSIFRFIQSEIPH